MIHLVTGCNPRYLERMRPYLDSLREHCLAQGRVAVHFVAVGWQAGADLQAAYPGFAFHALTMEQNYGAPAETECIQHGSFLGLIPGGPGDILLYTDGDLIMQREVRPAEIEWLEQFPDTGVTAGWNSGPQESLLVEADRIGRRVSHEVLIQALGERCATARCYNVGVVAARRSTWERIYRLYMERWEQATSLFAGPARQQWLIAWCFAALGLDVQLMPYTFHSHGHYGAPPGTTYFGGLVYQGAEQVLFRHKL